MSSASCVSLVGDPRGLGALRRGARGRRRRPRVPLGAGRCELYVVAAAVDRAAAPGAGTRHAASEQRRSAAMARARRCVMPPSLRRRIRRGGRRAAASGRGGLAWIFIIARSMSPASSRSSAAERLLDALRRSRSRCSARRLAQHVVDDLGLDARDGRCRGAGASSRRCRAAHGCPSGRCGRRALPPSLSLAWPGSRSSSSWTTRISPGAILKKRASAATDLPDRFMKVIGSSSHSGPAGRVDARGEAEVAALGHAGVAPSLRGDRVDEPEAGVVPGGLVFGARVAEADEQSDHGVGLSSGGARMKKPRRSGAREQPGGCAYASYFLFCFSVFFGLGRCSAGAATTGARPALPLPRPPGRWPRRSPGSACRASRP